jgi:thiamine pyrophosphokinase
MKCVIFANGEYKNPDFYIKTLEAMNDPYIICVDGGGNFTKEIGVTPDVILGDMDSISLETLKYYTDVEVRRYPVMKDKTDTKIAVELAIELGAKEVIIFGGLGFRMDHSLVNIYLLTLLLEAGIHGKIIDEKNCIFLMRGTRELNIPKGKTVSILPIGETVTGINITGFDYPIVNGEMTINNPYGVSNKTNSDIQTISNKKGILLVDISFD